MDIKKVVVTGDAFFIERFQPLFRAMSTQVNLDYLPYGNLQSTRRSQTIKKFLPKFLIQPAEKLFRKNQKTFINKSQETESKIRQLEYTPDLVFHLFGLFCPFWDKYDLPYVTYLDYTMALAERTWSPWAPFNNPKEREFWLDCERQAYTKAHHLFPMTNLVKNSLIKDYCIAPEKITVVGAAGNFTELYQGEKTFGSKQILFNGSDFERKGGDLVLAAFKQVKKTIPNAKLVIVGKKLATNEDGIENPGHIASASQMRDLFLNTDLVVAPAYCEPFGHFLVEAMNYGVPCVVSASGGMPEIVDHEINGVVISQPTSDILADRIINLLSKPHLLMQMSEKARPKIKNQLNWDNIATKIVQISSQN